MRILLRCVRDQLSLWKLWLPLVAMTVTLPFVVVGMPLAERQLIDDVLLAGQPALLLQTVVTYGGLWLLSLVIATARGALGAYLSERITLRVRQRLVQHSSDLSLAFWHREHTGRMQALFHNDAAGVANIFTSIVWGGIASVVGVVVTAVLMFHLNWQLAMLTVVISPVAAVVATLLTRPLRGPARRVQDKYAEVTERLQEYLAGMREVVAFGREETQARHFTSGLQQLLSLRMRLVFADSAFSIGQSLFSLVVFSAVLGYGGYLVLQGVTTLGTLLAMNKLFEQTYTTARQAFGLVKGIQTSLPAVERAYAFLDERPQIVEQPTARCPEHIAGRVEFERVSFAYSPERPVLHDVSFTAHPGEVVALVGPSGAGKTTLMSLIARFYDPSSGRVTIDGIDIRELRLSALRQAVGMVFQDTHLFATTIRENIAFGRMAASDGEVRHAAEVAHAWEFIERLPKGLDTPVGQRGVQLSEGQRQRIAIARAVLRDPRVLILDEPTSALDARSEALLQAAFRNLMQGRTTFIIAHRLATVQRADQILVLDDGHVVERGTHDELLGRNGLYHQLHRLQFGEQSRPVGEALPELPELVPALKALA